MATNPEKLLEILFENNNINKVLSVLDKSNDEVILNQVMWVFGNLTSENYDIIKISLIESNLIEKLVYIYNNFKSKQIKKNFIWIISNLLHTRNKSILNNYKVNNKL